jgi:glycosyltransferase involved in cell wall biosynthesis
MEPQISICIPHYNGGEVISRCLRSLFTQTVYNPGTVEIVVVDDCSDDGSCDLLQKYGEDGLVRLLRNQTRLGLTQNWNRALSAGRGEVVTLLHQDDWYDPHTLQQVVHLFQQNYDLALAALGQVYHPSDGSPSKAVPRFQPGIYSGSQYFRNCMNLQDTPAPSTVFFRRSYLSLLKTYYDSKYLFCSELDLYLRLALQHPEAKFTHDLAIMIQRGLSPTRFSVSHPGYRILDFCRVLNTYLPLLPSEDEQQYAKDAARRQIVTDVSALVKLGDMSQLKTVLESGLFQDWLRLEPRHQAEVQQIIQGVSPPPSGGYRMKTEPKPNPDPSPFIVKPISINPRFHFVSNYLFTPVLIVGFHHAGTRLIAKFLQDMGIYQVVDRQTYEWGYIQDLNTQMLPEWYDPQAVRSFDPHEGSFHISPLQIADLLLKSGYQGDRPWGHKDPRTCATLESWLEVFPSARVIHIMRDPLDVLGTLPAEYSKFTPEKCLPQQDLSHWTDLWMAYLERTLSAAPKAEKFIELRFEDLCGQPRLEMLRLAHDLDLPDIKQVAIDNIKSGKIGIHKKWIEEGRLESDDVEILKLVLRDYRARYRYDSTPTKRVILSQQPQITELTTHSSI